MSPPLSESLFSHPPNKERIMFTHHCAGPGSRIWERENKPGGLACPGNREMTVWSFVSFLFLGLQVAEADLH